MKKLYNILMIIFTLSLVSCAPANSPYPYVRYVDSSVRSDRDRSSDIPDGYVLNYGHSYDWVETEDGYDLIIHFKKEEN